jgi:uncharacterized protein YndB with AHSA1/START domain
MSKRPALLSSIVSIAVPLAVLLPQAASANVVGASANGFSVTATLEIAASPDEVYATLIKPAGWWSADHTFSGNAANLTLEARAGGCFCETLPDGGTVKHQEVVLAMPGKRIVMRGALGPLQAAGVIDAFAFTLDPDGAETNLTVTFTAGGYEPQGFEEWAKEVDFVMTMQASRLKRFVETGSAEGKK